LAGLNEIASKRRIFQEQMESIPIREAIGRRKTVPVTSDIIESAREIGISFGD